MKTLNLYFLMTAMLLGSAFCNKAFSQDTDNNGVWIEQEQKPEFPGGQEALIRFLSENVKYPP